MDEPAGVVTIVAKEDCRDQVLDLLKKMAEAAAKDDGCEIYSVHAARTAPDTFFLYELYRDKESFKLHQQNPQLGELGEQLRELTESLTLTVGNLVAGDRSVRG